MANILLKNIGKTYYNIGGDINAVTDFNLEIKDNEVVALLGPSGCGRTTTIYMLAGMEEITKGELYIDGKLMNDVPPKGRNIAMVFHNYAFFPDKTVFENIAFGLRPTDMSEYEIKGKVYEIARSFDILHVLDRKPNQISGGQQQRAVLARALIQDKDIMILDTPFSNLDAKLRAYTRTELMKIHQKYKKTYIYVTHDQDDAMAIADRLVIMKDGIIQQVGTPEELYSHPCNTFVAGFLGSPQMNIGVVKITGQDGSIYINFGGVKIKLPENKSDKASAYIGREVYAGIRPEDTFGYEADIKNFSDPNFETIDAEVQVREFLGDRIYLYCSICGESGVVTHVPPDFAAKSGDKIKIAVNTDKIYLFDKDTETAVIN